jgi:hypothetical protein
MKKSRFSEEKTIGTVKEHRAGASASDPCRRRSARLNRKIISYAP